jgi:hypothetical protein
MSEISYDEYAIEGYFEHSKSSEGNLSVAGNTNNHYVQFRLSDGHRLFFSAIVDGEEESDIAWDSRGIRCYISPNHILGERRFIVECNDSRFFSMMNRLISNIIQQDITGAENIISLFKAERLFWSGITNNMTQEKAAGLFGELYLMWRWLPKDIVAIIENEWWNGPTGSDKDFNFDNLQIEVKTSMSNTSPIRHTVSNLNQLQIETVPLLLFSLVARSDPGGSQSLCHLVEEISTALENESADLKDSFVDLLSQNDYVVDHPSMEQYNYNLPQGDGSFYVVTDGFPRLTNEDDSNDDRVHIETYSITLNQIDHLMLELTAPTTISDIESANI